MNLTEMGIKEYRELVYISVMIPLIFGQREERDRCSPFHRISSSGLSETLVEAYNSVASLRR